MSQDIKPSESRPAANPPSSKPGPASNQAVSPDRRPPARGGSALSVINMGLLLASLGLLGFNIYDRRQASTAEKPAKEAAREATKAEDEMKPEVAKLKGQVEDLTTKLNGLPAPPDFGPQIKSLDDRIAAIGKSQADIDGRIAALGKKLDAEGKGEGLDSSPKFQAIEKQVGELSQALGALKSKTAARPAETPVVKEDLDQGVALFKQGKYAEAKDEFVRLQSLSPDDARVWYYAALANGLATRDWRGTSERWVVAGMASEKAGKPERSKIDAAFADLTTATGKDWLAYYRNLSAQTADRR